MNFQFFFKDEYIVSEKKCSYDEMLKKIIEISNDHFEDPDAELSSETSKCIDLASSIFDKPNQVVRDDLTDLAQNQVQLQNADDELRYGNIDEYGDDKNS